MVTTQVGKIAHNVITTLAIVDIYLILQNKENKARTMKTAIDIPKKVIKTDGNADVVKVR